MNQNESDNMEPVPSSGRSIGELQKLLLQKEGFLRSKSRLIDNMAYQIRTLSNAIIGFSDLLLIEELTPELMEYVKEINQAGNGLSALVNEVLDWARLESGRIQVTKVKCTLGDFITGIERTMASVSSVKGLAYEVVRAELPETILTDADRLLKCLTNLIVNAVKNTVQGKFSLHVSCREHRQASHICFAVTDGGKEMLPPQIEQLFEPAMQEEDATGEILSMLNTGLTVTAGLPLTRQLAEALGGTIEVQSGIEGTTFSLLIPVGCSDACEIMTSAAVIRSDKPVFDAQRCESLQPASSVVLLVEDQPSNRTVISLILESLGVQVDTAQDGLEGVEAALRKDYGLILMDLKMPRMDGYEAARTIRQTNTATPLIALSAKVLSETENKQIAALFDGFLSKPIDSQKLAETLRQYLPDLPVSAKSEAAPAGAAREMVFKYGN